MTNARTKILLLLTLPLAACGGEGAFVGGCEPAGTMAPVCRFSNPEDIEALPDGRTLLVSQMGRSMSHPDPGSLVFFDTVSGEIAPAFPAPGDAAAPPAENWGAPDCPGNPGTALAPHGISLRQRADGRWQVAAVNHGGRESVELFELTQTAGRPALQWRGCVVPPEGSFLNDVVLMRDGGFVASHMFDKREPPVAGISLGIFKAMVGVETGHVFEWQSGRGFRVLEGSHGAFINGVELSADEAIVYASVYFGGEVRKLDRASGRKLGAAPVAHSDNLAWDGRGALLAVAHTGSLPTHIECNKQPGRTCALAYAVHRIDPAAMQTEVLLQHSGPPMGAATVARELNGALWLGSFTGDRMVRVPYPEPRAAGR